MKPRIEIEQHAVAEKQSDVGLPYDRELPAPADPMGVARVFVDERCTLDGVRTLRHWRGGWWRWDGTKWTEIEHRAILSEAYEFTERAFYATRHGSLPWGPNHNKVANFLEAVAALTFLPEETPQPGWLDGRDQGGAIVSCANGLLDVTNGVLLAHTPRYFNCVSVPHEYDPDSLDPERWSDFLEALWGDDRDQVLLLQEWFGYTLSGRTDMHKILLLVGPTRAGKGVICRMLARLVGPQSVVGPTLNSLKGEFGLAPLLGKPLAIVSDARLNGRDSLVVVERLLSVSGEDALTVNRKFREQWTGTLPARFVICSNELPRLGDASGAIAGRFVTLLLEQSFLGREDRALEAALALESGSILNWALAGLARLERQGQFTVPSASQLAYETLVDLGSPVQAFLREACHVARDLRVPVTELWAAWRSWCEDNGEHHRTKQVFGRDLRAAVPHLRTVREGGRGEQQRVFVGVGLKERA